jgi:hypothetical protein
MTQGKIKILVARVSGLKVEEVSLNKNRDLLSFTFEERIGKIDVTDVKMAFGFEKNGLMLKFDDYALCFNDAASDEDDI